MLLERPGHQQQCIFGRRVGKNLSIGPLLAHKFESYIYYPLQRGILYKKRSYLKGRHYIVMKIEIKILRSQFR